MDVKNGKKNVEGFPYEHVWNNKKLPSMAPDSSNPYCSSNDIAGKMADNPQ
jgi:hypothetical protein